MPPTIEELQANFLKAITELDAVKAGILKENELLRKQNQFLYQALHNEYLANAMIKKMSETFYYTPATFLSAR